MKGNFQAVVNDILNSVVSANISFRETQLSVYSHYLANLGDHIKLNGVSPADFIKGQQLGIRELRFTFHAIPLRPNVFSRVWFSMRFALGRVKADLVYLDDASIGPGAGEPIEVVLIVSTGDFKTYQHRIEPATIDPARLITVR